MVGTHLDKKCYYQNLRMWHFEPLQIHLGIYFGMHYFHLSQGGRRIPFGMKYKQCYYNYDSWGIR